jgi:hypothetical protein
MDEVKLALTNLMGTVMPYMDYLVYIGGAFLVLGAIALLIWFFADRCTWLLRLSGRLLVLFGLIFLLSTAVAYLLGWQPPYFNYGDVANYEFDKKLYFWVLGIVFFAGGFVFRIFGSLRATH